jgi:predicted ATP-grasp superfamily ATP-dependent carboligase
MQTVLLTDGEFTGLIRCLREGYGDSVRIVLLSTDPYFAHQSMGDAYYIVKNCGHPDYISDLIEIIRLEKVDIIFPIETQGMEHILASGKLIFESTGARILSSPLEAVAKCNNKHAFYLELERAGFSDLVPKYLIVHSAEELLRAVSKFQDEGILPCIKRISGENAEGFKIIVPKPDPGDFYPNGMPGDRITNAALTEMVGEYPADKVFPSYMVCKYLPGREWDCDILSKEGTALCVTIRENIRMNGGLTAVLRTSHNELLESLCIKITSLFNLSYVSCISFREDSDGRPYLLEINPRMMGNIYVSSLSGNNYAKMALDLFDGLPVYPEIPVDGIITSMYYSQARIDPLGIESDWRTR